MALTSDQQQDPTGREAVRFEATVHPRPGVLLAAAAVEQRVSRA